MIRMKPDDLIVEARAQIIWGEPSSSVHFFLTSNGMSAADADAKIKEFNAERNTEIRKTGLKNTFIGAVLAGGAGLLLYMSLEHSSSIMSYRSARGIAVIVLAGLYGIWKLVNGLIYLVRPQSEERSITEL